MNVGDGDGVHEECPWRWRWLWRVSVSVTSVGDGDEWRWRVSVTTVGYECRWRVSVSIYSSVVVPYRSFLGCLAVKSVAFGSKWCKASGNRCHNLWQRLPDSQLACRCVECLYRSVLRAVLVAQFGNFCNVLYKSSAVAEMGDRLAILGMGRNWGEAAVAAGSPSNTMWPGSRPTSLPSGILIHPTVWPQL